LAENRFSAWKRDGALDELLTAVAGTLRDMSVRSRFLSQRAAASLLD